LILHKEFYASFKVASFSINLQHFRLSLKSFLRNHFIFSFKLPIAKIRGIWELIMAIDISSLNSIKSTGKYNPQATSMALRGQLSRNILGSFPDTYKGGISSNLLYKIYDSKAISPAIMAAYLEKVRI
jgi:hypothetical protein